VLHDSGRDVNAALLAGGVIAESIIVEQPGLEDRFIEITRPETALPPPPAPAFNPAPVPAPKRERS
jgi:hypothetical protein